MQLIDQLIKNGFLKTPRIIDAFREIKRVDFVPDNIKNLADLNEALPIGYGQTISQPLVVAFILELLQPEEGQKILDIGSGSGWTSSLLAYIVSRQEASGVQGKQGKVVAIEVIPELKSFGEANTAKYGFVEQGVVKFIHVDGSVGYAAEAPYDRILASAAGKRIPESWREQVKVGGRIVAPVGSSIFLLIKKGDNAFEEKEFPGFAFVPLV